MLALIWLIYDRYIQLIIIDTSVNSLPLTSMRKMTVHDRKITVEYLGMIILYI